MLLARVQGYGTARSQGRQSSTLTGSRFANRQKGAGFLGSKHASHPINAMLNYAYVVEAGKLAKALAARGLALSIGFLHSDKKGRNSLVWDAIEPLRPAIDARVFAFVASREFARSDFPQTGVSTFRLERDVISEMFGRVATIRTRDCECGRLHFADGRAI